MLGILAASYLMCIISSLYWIIKDADFTIEDNEVAEMNKELEAVLFNLKRLAATE